MIGNTGAPAISRILYVDDEPALLDIGKVFLEESGSFTVDTSPSAPDALIRLSSHNYDAIVSDYQMPKMDGIAFLKTLRAQGDTTPFIIFTGRGREDVVIEALNSGADFYLQKGGDPVSQFAELAHKILHAISQKRAGRALKKSEADYRHLIEHAGEAIFVIQDERFRMINPRAAELSGYSEQELLNQPFVRFIHPDEAAILLDKFRNRNFDSTVPTHYTFRTICKDTTVRWVELNVVAITWDERSATLNFMIDITNRKLAEDALRESEERYRQFFRTTLDGLFITTPAGQWIDFNDAVVEMFGFDNRDEIFKRPIISFYVNPEDRVAFVERVEREGYVKENPVSFRKRNGTVFDSVMTVVVQRNPDGSTKAFIGTIRDITELKRAGTALRESEERYRHIFESFVDLYYQTDIDGIITILSPSLNRLTGWTEKELIGTSITKIYVNPEDRQVLLDELAEKGYVRDYEVLLLKQDGTETPVSLSANRIFHPDGSPAGVAGIIRDITRRKQAEGALKESEVKFRSLVDHALEAIMIIDMQGKVLFCNNAAARTLDAETCEDLIGRNVMGFIAPESRDNVAQDLKEVAKGNDAFLVRYHLISAKGREVSVECIGKMITYEGRSADLISLRDVTGQKQ